MHLLSRFASLAVAAGLSLGLAAPAVRAETKEIRIAQQFGLAYLPLIIVKNQNLIEKHLTKHGLPPATVTWARLSGGTAANDALLTGSVDYVAAGIAPLLILWDKSRGNLDVRAIGGLDASSTFLNTNNPNVKTLRDFTDKDRIALPAVKSSIQAVMLQIAVEKEFGIGQHERLDKLTVTLPHPDATVALLGGKSEITGHFTTPPFNHQQLEQQGIRRVTSSYEIFGGPTTVTSVYATGKFRAANPKTFQAVFDAFKEGHELIARDPDAAAKIFIEEEKSKLGAEWVQKLLRDPTIKYTLTPQNTQKIADFLYRVGTVKNKPETWRDYFFADLHDQQGS
ncbi:ABC transporter substrate-binding protein [Ferrovibrio sp. MS7]|uniref:ABC transporter substrate-binding protein n=1 Tax=Ferrovibrio plantarum TaxID=3119164 RepID=UPI003135EDEB